MKETLQTKSSYKKLWKLLIDKDMNETDLRKATGISTFTVAKMTRGDDVNLSILKRICQALKCGIGDIVEFIPDDTIKRGRRRKVAE